MEMVTDEDMCNMARAVHDAGAHGLPMLSDITAARFRKVTGMGVAELAHALINHCPQVTRLNLRGIDPATHEAVAEMVRVAGCRHRVKIDV